LKFSVCASLVQNAVSDAEYYLNVLLPFSQDNALMVVVDSGGLVLDWYEQLALADATNFIATWLRFLTYTPNRNIEKIEVEVVQNGETFFRIADATTSGKNLLVWSQEPWAVQQTQFPDVEVLDRNAAKRILSKSKGQKVKSKDKKGSVVKVKATGGANVNVAQNSKVGGSQAAGTKTVTYAERGALVAQIDGLVLNQPDAIEAWASFKTELAKAKPQSSILKSAWQKVVEFVPAAAAFATNVAAIIASVAPK
jgi:hypothetical protein